MTSPSVMWRPSHLLLDFFGTIVEYSPSRTEQGFHHSHSLLGSLGCHLSYPHFLEAWSRTSADFDAASDVDYHEFSMDEVTTEFLRSALGRAPTATEVQAMRDSYLKEWNAGVTYPAFMDELIRRLAADFTLVVVTNTHQADLVPTHLEAMGVANLITGVVSSVEVGWRKPHPAIYRVALSRAGINPTDAVFVGDTYLPDYVGPLRAGIPALLIDAHYAADVPSEHRLESLFDLPARLGM